MVEHYICRGCNIGLHDGKALKREKKVTNGQVILLIKITDDIASGWTGQFPSTLKFVMVTIYIMDHLDNWLNNFFKAKS